MKLEEITSRIDPEEGWNDIFLKITDQTKTSSSVIYTAKGLYEEQIVGICVEVQTNMIAGLLPSGEINRDAFYRDGIKFFSIGVESDRLLKALSALYEFPTDRPIAKTIEGAMTFSLNENPVNLAARKHYKFKMFFQDDNEDLYCEIFCNVDLAGNVIELHEKDEEYRENIIKNFACQLQ
jgi:hypothetical protein